MTHSLLEADVNALDATQPTYSLGAYGLGDDREARFRRPVPARPDAFFETRYDLEQRTYWAMLRADCPPKFTLDLVRALREGQRRVREWLCSSTGDADLAPRYQVFGSRIPGVFSLGGDLELFRELIALGDGAGLESYARECIDVVYTNAVNYRLGITTVSLVQGQALGGGFEAALAANVVVAERGCRMGLPEVLFNLFPGMGAYQLLCRRMAPLEAERFIESGRTYRAEELYEMGVIDVLADVGEGENAVMNYIRSHSRSGNGRRGLRRAIQRVDPIDYAALIDTAEVWAETALELEARDLSTIEYLLKAQLRMNAQAEG